MQCGVCGHKNPSGATHCASCGSGLGAGSPVSQPVSSTPGISTGGTQGEGARSGFYTPYLTKGLRLENGHYAVGEVLGQGGFGITYKGGDLALRRYVAIKEFFPAGCARQGATVHPSGTWSAADFAGAKAKFAEEARTLARFNDPGIVRVFGVFEENNTAYMVMEFLEGKTLSKRLETEGTLPESDAVEIISKVGQALKSVHAADLIHRDIKPDNICLTNDGRVVLIDFGTARSFAAGKTVKQTTLLTPGYAPLEQYGQQARFGSYTDIYALAATLYHCLTGQIPPQATDRAAGVELKAPRDLNPKISLAVSQAIVWAMQLKADQRPQSIDAFSDALKKGVQAPLQPPQPPPDSGWGQNAPPQTPTNAYASVQKVADNQILTDAAPHEVLETMRRAFEGFGVKNPTVDGATYRVYGSTGVDLRSWQQNIVGQVTQDARGVLITLQSTPSAGLNDYGRGKDETRRLAQAVAGALKTLSAAPSMAPPPNYAPQTYAPPIASPYGAPQPYAPSPYLPSRPMPQRQGGSVLSLGLLGIFCCGFCAPFAWINGNKTLADYGDLDPGDRGTVQAGRVLGIIGTVLWGLYLSAAFLSGLGS